MIFRFMGQIPKHRFEFTCYCGQWNAFELEEGMTGKTFNCAGSENSNRCIRKIRIWQQRTHWHVSVEACDLLC